MKKFTKFSLPLLFSIFLLQACTKDIVPDPDTLNAQLGSQVTIYNQNFDSSATFPSGWLASPVNNGWQIKNTNPSSGYAGASGKNNMDISNATGVTDTFSLMSNSISTTGYKNITVTYGVRNSSNFDSSGSAIVGFYYSIDAGNSWLNLPYTENTNNSLWSIINGGARIKLPSNAANLEGGVIFKWVAYLKSSASGSYRFDDFEVFGTSM